MNNKTETNIYEKAANNNTTKHKESHYPWIQKIPATTWLIKHKCIYTG